MAAITDVYIAGRVWGDDVQPDQPHVRRHITGPGRQGRPTRRPGTPSKRA